MATREQDVPEERQEQPRRRGVMDLFGGPPEIATRTDVVERLIESGRRLVGDEDAQGSN